ncbi:hypothetical protein BHE74_00000936 [Ensete ventricosum]|nr:hypothetical protein BHE74_00000936 [Ensete ventricosum]
MVPPSFCSPSIIAVRSTTSGDASNVTGPEIDRTQSLLRNTQHPAADPTAPLAVSSSNQASIFIRAPHRVESRNWLARARTPNIFDLQPQEATRAPDTMLRVVDRRRNSFRRFVLLAYFSQLYPHSPFCFPSTTFTTLLAVYRMKMVQRRSFPAVALPLLAVWALVMVVPCFAGNPYAYFDWDVSFITAAPLGVKQQVLSSVSSRLLLQCTCIPLLFCEVSSC